MGSGMTSTVSGCTDMWSVSTREERHGREFDMKSCTKMKNDKREDWWFPLKSWIIDSVWVLKKVPLLLLCTLKSIEVRCTKNRNDYFMVSFFFAFQPSLSVYDMTIPLALKYTLLSPPRKHGANLNLLQMHFCPTNYTDQIHWTTKIVAPPIRPKCHPPDQKPNCCCCCRRTRKGSSEWTTHRCASFPIPLCGKIPSSGLIGASTIAAYFISFARNICQHFSCPPHPPPLLLGPGVSLSRNPPPRVKTHTSPERLSTCIYNMADKGKSSSSSSSGGGGGGGGKEAVGHGTNEQGNQVKRRF